MKTDMEMDAQMQAQASWRVAVTQGQTLLGFKEWVIECMNYPPGAKTEEALASRMADSDNGAFWPRGAVGI